MTTTPIELDSQALADNALAELFVSMPLINGSLLASADGRVLAADLEGRKRQKSTAAIVASSFALGGRLAELTGSSEVAEMVVRSRTGFVSIFAVGDNAALVVLSQPNTNMGLLNLRARTAVEVLVPLLPNWAFSDG